MTSAVASPTDTMSLPEAPHHSNAVYFNNDNSTTSPPVTSQPPVSPSPARRKISRPRKRPPVEPKPDATLSSTNVSHNRKKKQPSDDENEHPLENIRDLGRVLMSLKKDQRYIDQIVWAKIKGFPNWPAQITDIQGDKLKVCFYGEGTFSFVYPKNTKPFEVADATRELEKYQKLVEQEKTLSRKHNHLKMCESITQALEELAANADVCFICEQRGFLICCDGCSNAAHVECAGLTDVPDESTSWFCSECVAKGQERADKRRIEASSALREAIHIVDDAIQSAFNFNIAAPAVAPPPAPQQESTPPISEPDSEENAFYIRRDPVEDVLTRSYWRLLRSSGESRKRKRRERTQEDDDDWQSSKKRNSKKQKKITKRALRFKRRRLDELQEGTYSVDSVMARLDAYRITEAQLQNDIECMQEEQPSFDVSVKHFAALPFRGQKVVRWHWAHEEHEENMFFPQFNGVDIDVLTMTQLWEYLAREDSRIEEELCDLRYWCNVSKGWMLIRSGFEFSFHDEQILKLRMVRSGKNDDDTHLYKGREYAKRICGVNFGNNEFE